MGNKSNKSSSNSDGDDENDDEVDITCVEEIPTWQKYFENKEEELINRQPLKGKGFEYDTEINSRVSLYKGDIACLQVDGIVISNNSDLAILGGVSERVAQVAGQELRNEVKKLNGCKTGEAKTTEGYNLPADYVIHTVGPVGEDANLLESCYKSSLEEMQSHDMESLAFCSISTGTYNYPKEKAALIALRTVRQWMDEKKKANKLCEIDRIIFCLYTSIEVTLYENWMQVFFPCCEKSEMDLLPLTGYVKLTITEPDMLGLDDGRRQAKMPCGHVIGPESLAEYCRQNFAKGVTQLFCPHSGPPACNTQWEYFIVRHVARLTPEELAEFEKKIAENYLMKAKGMQRCPGCKTYCFRGQGVGVAVRCPLCTENTGKAFDFCWWCERKWLTSTSNPPCGNPECDGTDRRLSILASCPTKQINACLNCPSVRGCPKCGILIEHIDKCAHMECTNCHNYGFCFICLKEMIDGQWQCAPWDGSCVLQPRQTTLPGSI